MRHDRPRRNTKYIISDERAFAYFVVPKVACSSVKTALLPLFPDVRPEGNVEDDAFAYRVHGLFDRSPHQIDKAALLAGLRRPGGRYADYFKFAFVRNPFDRLVSCYSQKLAPWGPRQGLGREVYAGGRLYVGMGFEEFALTVCRTPDRRSNGHFRSQHTFVCSDDPEKRILADFVGRYENLAEDFDHVAGKIGLQASLPYLLSSERGDYRDFYDGRLAALVGERYRLDAELFGYSF